MSKKKEVPTPERKFTRVQSFRLANRVNHSVRVTLADGNVFMLAPGETTLTQYNKKDIKHVDGFTPDSEGFRRLVMNK